MSKTAARVVQTGPVPRHGTARAADVGAAGHREGHHLRRHVEPGRGGRVRALLPREQSAARVPGCRGREPRRVAAQRGLLRGIGGGELRRHVGVTPLTLTRDPLEARVLRQPERHLVLGPEPLELAHDAVGDT